MFAEAFKIGQKVAASAGFTEDPDVVAEREQLEMETTERRQRLQVHFQNESMVMEQVAERAEMSEDFDEEDYDDNLSTDFDDEDWGDC